MKRNLLLTVCVGLALLLLGGSVSIAGEGDWMVRTRLIAITPDTSSDGTLDFLNAEVGDDVTIEVDVTYFITDRWAIEAIAATAGHDVVLTIPNGTGKANGDEVNLGSVNILPPTVLLQYHFMPDGNTRPYVGLGLNYTVFYNQSGALDTPLFVGDFDDLDNSMGFAGQVGIDFMLSESMSFNIDLKYVQVETDVSVEGEDLGELEINPYIIGFGLGWRF